MNEMDVEKNDDNTENIVVNITATKEQTDVGTPFLPSPLIEQAVFYPVLPISSNLLMLSMLQSVKCNHEE